MTHLNLHSNAHCKNIIFAMSLLFLTGCMSRYDPVQFIKPQSFQLHDVSVVWINNPTMQIDMEYTKSKFDPKASPSEDMQKSMQDRVKDIVQLLQTEAATSLSKELEKGGVNKGTSYRIVLQPTSAYHSSSGFIGTRIRVKISVFDQAGEQKWGWSTYATDDGYTLGHGIGKPSTSFVTNFVSETMRSFRKAQLVN